MPLNIVRGVDKSKPKRLMVYGEGGIGKTTFGSSIPGALIFDLEDGANDIGPPRLDSEKLPTYAKVKDAVASLTRDREGFAALVIDTGDKLEAMLQQHVCAVAKKTSIEEFGYGKGYQYALEEWRVFLKALELLQQKQGLDVVILAHAHVKPHDMPDGQKYDRWTPKMHDKASGLLREWVSAQLFARTVVSTYAEKGEKRKAFSDGARVVETSFNPAWWSKNRWGLPPQLPLDWGAIVEAYEAGAPSPLVDLQGEANDLFKRLSPDRQAKAEPVLAAAWNNERGLETFINQCKVRLAQAPRPATDQPMQETALCPFKTARSTTAKC